MKFILVLVFCFTQALWANPECEDIHDISNTIVDENEREFFKLLFNHKQSFELGKCSVEIKCKHRILGENDDLHNIYFSIDLDQGDDNPAGLYIGFVSSNGSAYRLSYNPKGEKVEFDLSKRKFAYRSELIYSSFPAKAIDKLTFDRQTGTM